MGATKYHVPYVVTPDADTTDDGSHLPVVPQYALLDCFDTLWLLHDMDPIQYLPYGDREFKTLVTSAGQPLVFTIRGGWTDTESTLIKGMFNEKKYTQWLWYRRHVLRCEILEQPDRAGDVPVFGMQLMSQNKLTRTRPTSFIRYAPNMGFKIIHQLKDYCTPQYIRGCVKFVCDGKTQCIDAHGVSVTPFTTPQDSGTVTDVHGNILSMRTVCDTNMDQIWCHPADRDAAYMVNLVIILWAIQPPSTMGVYWSQWIMDKVPICISSSCKTYSPSEKGNTSSKEHLVQPPHEDPS